MPNTARITKAYAEVVSDTTPPAKITKVYAEVVSDTTPPAKITKVYMEVVVEPGGNPQYLTLMGCGTR